MTLEGGFLTTPNAPRHPIASIGATRERRPGRAPANASLSLTPTFGDAVELQARALSDVSFGVDGRGEFGVALCEVGDGAGQAMWATQRRTLPRPPPQSPLG